MFDKPSLPSGKKRFHVLSAALLSAAIVLPPFQGTVKAAEAPSAGVLEFEYTSAYALESEGTAYLTIKRTGGSAGEVSVQYTTSDGSASSWSDYSAVTDVITFADGETSKEIVVPISNDSDMEGDEDFYVSLSNPTGGATLGPGSAANVTIGDDDYWIPDPAGVLQLEYGSYTVNEGEGYISFNVFRTDGAGGTVSVDVGIGGGSATDGYDFSGGTQTLTFTEGQTWASFGVPITDDYEVEGDETFSVGLFNATGGATIGTLSSAGVTITDNDVFTPPASVFALEGSSYDVGEGDGYAYLTVVRSGGLGAVSVEYSTSDGSANAGSDYEGTSGTLSFADEEQFKTIQVPIINDTDMESTEDFLITLSNPSEGAELGFVTAANVNITDDDEWIPDPPGVLQLEKGVTAVYEGDSFASFNVYRTEGAGGQVTVDYGVGGGSATEGQDFTAASGTLVFNEGETVKTIDVPLLDDYDYEGNEDFYVSLGNTSGGATVGAISSTHVTIFDNETPPLNNGIIAFDGGVYGVKEGDGSVVLYVNRTEGLDGEVSVDYAAVAGTAGSSDFTPVTGTLTFADGEASKTITITVADDTVVESNENFTVTLSNPAGGAQLGSIAAADVTITDNDAAPAPTGTIQFENKVPWVNEGGKSVTLKVLRQGGSTGKLSVKYTTVDGPAVAGKDYTAAQGVLVFENGETSKTITIPILDDKAKETLENFSLKLYEASPTGALGEAFIMFVVISDND